MIIFIGPRVKESKINFFIRGDGMSKAPLDPPLIVFLHQYLHTIAEISTFSRIRFH